MARANLNNIEEAVLLYLAKHKDTDLSAEDISDAIKITENQTIEALNSLRERGYVDGPPSLLQKAMDALSKIDAKFTPISEGYAEHIILLASALERADEAFLAASLGYDAELVNLVGSRLRSSGIWTNHIVAESHLDEWRKESLLFFLDAAVGCGDLQIVSRSPQPQYQMTPGGRSRVEAMMLRK